MYDILLENSKRQFIKKKKKKLCFLYMPYKYKQSKRKV